MLRLLENERCPYSSTCQYNQYNTCNGADSQRTNAFECEYVVNGSIVENGSIRSNLDQTGNMKVIME